MYSHVLELFYSSRHSPLYFSVEGLPVFMSLLHVTVHFVLHFGGGVHITQFVLFYLTFSNTIEKLSEIVL